MQKKDGEADGPKEDVDFIKQMQEYVATEALREEEARKQEEEHQRKLEELRKQHEALLKGASELAASDVDGGLDGQSRLSDYFKFDDKIDDSASDLSKQTRITVKQGKLQ